MNYYKNEERKKLLCSYDLLLADRIEVTTRFGDIEITMQDGKVLCLKAKDDQEADAWAENMMQRHELYSTLPSHHKKRTSFLQKILT